MFPPQAASRPNIILVLADDMGFSDVGGFGSEIRTPNIDRLAAGGLRFTQMYTVARCCPSRASLLTGLHPHQAGIGHMTLDLGAPGYHGYLGPNCVTIAEVLRQVGYRTLMSGKWHVGGNYSSLNRERWNDTSGDARHPVPSQPGFDRFHGIVNGMGSSFDPVTLVDWDRFIRAESAAFYFTDAVTDKAIEMLQELAEGETPSSCTWRIPPPIGPWKLVGEQGKTWELYSMEEDRTELHDLAGRNPGKVAELATLYAEHASRCGALHWPITARETVPRMRGRHIHLSTHKGRKSYP